MKYLKLTLFFIAITISSIGTAQEVWTDKSRVLPDKLREVLTIIYLNHYPNPCYPQNNDDPKRETQYVWKHNTSVCSPYKTLKVVEAGSFIWFSEKGWFKNVEYSKKDFSKRFNCKNGILEKDSCYTFDLNFRYGNNLYGGDALWFVLAEDDEGTLYKGMGIIETESVLKPQSNE